MSAGGNMPEAFGPYRVVEKLGEGGMGVVFLAVSPDFRLVAVKALRPWLVGGGEGRARFAREVEVMRRVRGRRVAEVIDADVDADPAFVVTRYVRGPALPTMVADHGPLQAEALVRLATGLLEALATVHAAGLVHRDVKPGNVLISGRDPVLIDFGLARAVDETRLTSTGMVAGTPGYLAPESIIGAEPTPATDVHGWAATVSFAGTGRPPFGTGPDSVVLDRIRRGDHDTDGLPEPVAGLVLAGLHDDPTKRPTVDDLLRELTGDGADAVAAASAAAGGPIPGSVSTDDVPEAPAPPPRRDEGDDVATEAIGGAVPVAAASGAVHGGAASGTAVGAGTDTVDEATEDPEPWPTDRPDDADTQENPVVRAGSDPADATATVADVGSVSSRPGPSDATVVIPRRPEPPTVVQSPPVQAPPSTPPAPKASATKSSTPPGPGPHQHPYAGDGAPLQAWSARSVVLTAGFALVVLGGLVPWVAATVLVAAMVLGRAVWRVRRRMYERVVSRGPGKHDRLVVGLAAPVDLALAVLPALGQAAVSLGAGLLVGLAFNPLSGLVGERTPLLVGAVTAAAVAWWGPWAGRFRHGIRVLVAPTERRNRLGWIIAAVFFVTAWVLALVWEVYGTSWWPGSGPPNPLGL